MFHIPKRGQTAAEFIIVLILLLIVLVFLFSIYLNSVNEITLRKENAAAKRIVDTLALGINDVYLSGTPQTITIPRKILGREAYVLGILENEHLVYLQWTNGYYSYPIITSNVSYGTLAGGSLSLAYIDGEVVIS
jgi:hypothetical protein